VPRVRVRPRHPREDSVGPVAVETAPLRRTRLLLAFRSPSFRLLWAGQTVSLIGDGAFLVALGWRTTQLTGKSSSLALVLMVQGIGLLTTLLVGGALADRYPRRALMILSDTARCTTMVALTVADATGHLSLGVLLGLGFAFGLGDGFFYPAFGGIVPLVVETGELASANTLIGVSRQGAFVLGPALAGGIYGFAGPPAVFGFDAGTFLVSAALLVLARPRELAPEPHEGTFRSILDGARYVAGVPWLWIGIAAASVILMVAMAPFQALLPRFVQTQFGLGVGSYGLLFALQSVGMLGGTLAFGQLDPKRRRVAQIFGAFSLNDFAVIGMTFTHSYAAAAALVAVRGLLIGYGISIWGTLLMQEVPLEKLSRVTSLDYFGSTGLVPVGYALTAVLSAALAPATILLIGFSLAAVLWSAPLLARQVRDAA